MIFILLAVFVILFLICVTLIKNKMVSNVLSLILGALIISCVGLSVLNFSDNFGMKKQTTISKTKFTSVNKNMDMILYQKIGKSNDQVVIYKKNSDQKKPTAASPINTKNYIKTGQKDNVLVTKTQNWVYKNKFYQNLFYFTGKTLLIKRTNTFDVNNGTLVLSTNQAKAFGKAMKEQSAQMKAKEQSPETQNTMRTQGQQFVQAKVMEAMSKNPSMSVKQKQKVAEQAMSEFKASMMNKAKQQMEERAMKSVQNIK